MFEWNRHKLKGVFVRLPVILLVGVLLSGCGESSINSLPVNPGNSAVGLLVPAKETVPGLSFQIGADKATYRTGEPIQFTLSVTNISGQERDLSFSNSSPVTWWGYCIAQYGHIVTYEYWTGHKLAFTDSIGNDRYLPGATHTFPYSFPYLPDPQSPPIVSTLRPGVYQAFLIAPAVYHDGAKPVFHDVPTPLSDPIEITVLP